MTHQAPENTFLRDFYKVFVMVGFAGQVVPFFFGWRAALSYFLGMFIFGFLFLLWDLTLLLVLNPERPSPTLGYLLIFLRYGLLAGLFYAMMALFVVNWIWFAIGSGTLLPSLLITTFFFDHRPNGS